MDGWSCAESGLSAFRSVPAPSLGRLATLRPRIPDGAGGAAQVSAIFVAVAAVRELPEATLALHWLCAIGQRQSGSLGRQQLAACELLRRLAAVA